MEMPEKFSDDGKEKKNMHKNIFSMNEFLLTMI